MTPKPECVSDMLRDLQRNMNQVILEHGSIHLDRNSSAKLVVRLGEMAEFARQLENAWSQAEWNRRAVSDRMELIASMTRVSAEILGLMRPDAPTEGKVLPFRRPSPETNPGPSAPPGGNAA